MRALNDSSLPLLSHGQGGRRHRQTGPTHVPKEFTAFSPAFGLCLQQHEIGHFANARCSLMNSREVFLVYELYERFGVLFLRQPDLINNHVVTPFVELVNILDSRPTNTPCREAGDFIYIKPGVPHEVFNMSDTEPVVAFVARSSADEWDNIIPYDRNQR